MSCRGCVPGERSPSWRPAPRCWRPRRSSCCWCRASSSSHSPCILAGWPTVPRGRPTSRSAPAGAPDRTRRPWTPNSIAWRERERGHEPAARPATDHRRLPARGLLPRRHPAAHARAHGGRRRCTRAPTRTAAARRTRSRRCSRRGTRGPSPAAQSATPTRSTPSSRRTSRSPRRCGRAGTAPPPSSPAIRTSGGATATTAASISSSITSLLRSSTVSPAAASVARCGRWPHTCRGARIPRRRR